MSPDRRDDPSTGDERNPGDDGTVDLRDLLGAYALDAVDDVERRAIERYVASDPAAERELRGLTATAALLGGAVAARPPAELRSAVLAEIARTPQVGTPVAAPGGPAVLTPIATPSEPTSLAPRRAGVPRRTVWLAVAATALGAAAIPSAVAWQQAQQNHRIEVQAQAVADLLAEPGARVVRSSVTGGGTAVGVLANDRALFTATGLGDPGAGKVYQLWLLRDGAALPDAVLPDDAGSVRAITNHFVPGDALAVTIEPAGVSLHPTTDTVVVLAEA